MVQREVAEDMDRRNYSTNTGQISPSPNEIKMQKEQSEKVEFLTLLHTLELLTGAVTIKKKITTAGNIVTCTTMGLSCILNHSPKPTAAFLPNGNDSSK